MTFDTLGLRLTLQPPPQGWSEASLVRRLQLFLRTRTECTIDVQIALVVSCCFPFELMTEGISKSGKQLGLQDPRSALIKSVFDVIDSCPYLQLSAQLDARSGSCFGNAQLTDPYFISGHLLFWRTLRPCSAPNCVVCGPTS